MKLKHCKNDVYEYWIDSQDRFQREFIVKSDGKLEQHIAYKDGFHHGECRFFYKNGMIKSHYYKINGLHDGEQIH